MFKWVTLFLVFILIRKIINLYFATKQQKNNNVSNKNSNQNNKNWDAETVDYKEVKNEK